MKLFSIVCMSSLIACSAQNDGEYPGEVLAKLQGSVSIDASASSPGDVDVLVQWSKFTGRDTAEAARAPTTGSFPSRFTVHILTPTAAIYNKLGTDPDEPSFAFAGIGVVRRGFVGTIKDESDVLGMDENHTLVYLPEAVVTGTRAAAFLGGPLSQGFHILDIVRLPRTTEALAERKAAEQKCFQENQEERSRYIACHRYRSDTLKPSALDLDTELTLRIANDLNYPNLY